MKKKMIMTVLAGSSLLVAQNSFASDVSLIPRASVGLSHYSATWDIAAQWSDWGGRWEL